MTATTPEKKIAIDVVRTPSGVVAMLPEARIMTDPSPGMTQAPLPREETQGYRWAPWGTNDRFPTEVRRKLEKVPQAGNAVYKLIARMYGNGLGYYRNSDLDDGNTTVRRARIPAVEQFIRRNRLHLRWMIPQFADYRYYMQAFGECILNKRRDQITGIYHKPAEFCRLAKQNEQTLDIEELYYSPDFVLGHPPSDTRMVAIPMMTWYDEERFFRKMTGYKFAYHSRFETPGVTYYARPFWVGLFRQNGWIDISVTAPEIINAMMKNQVAIVYQILIPESYYWLRHQEWNTYTDLERNKIIDAHINELNTALKGSDNLYRSISTVFKQDDMGTALGKVEIIAIDDKLKRDAWIPNSSAADAQIVQGLGLHPSQVGLAPEGGKMGAGSGSDQRESYNTSITDNTIDQEVMLEWLNYAAWFNATGGQPWTGRIVNPDWDITFFIDHIYHTTTNDQESGMKPDDNTITMVTGD